MKYDDEMLEKFRRVNQEKFDRAAAQAKQTLGRDAAVLDDLLKDKDRLKQLLKFVSKEDLDKFSTVLDDPALIQQILSSEKAMANIRKILGDK